mmetsp:Transcript_32637/g.92551  ORF Transcript_32637/g.92551 Transcript_32637/m.92551 type:complete len:1420 (+) Transcript_32637:271-4530(+)
MEYSMGNSADARCFGPAGRGEVIDLTVSDDEEEPREAPRAAARIPGGSRLAGSGSSSVETPHIATFPEPPARPMEAAQRAADGVYSKDGLMAEASAGPGLAGDELGSFTLPAAAMGTAALTAQSLPDPNAPGQGALSSQIMRKLLQELGPEKPRQGDQEWPLVGGPSRDPRLAWEPPTLLSGMEAVGRLRRPDFKCRGRMWRGGSGPAGESEDGPAGGPVTTGLAGGGVGGGHGGGPGQGLGGFSSIRGPVRSGVSVGPRTQDTGQKLEAAASGRALRVVGQASPAADGEGGMDKLGRESNRGAEVEGVGQEAPGGGNGAAGCGPAGLPGSSGSKGAGAASQRAGNRAHSIQAEEPATSFTETSDPDRGGHPRWGECIRKTGKSRPPFKAACLPEDGDEEEVGPIQIRRFVVPRPGEGNGETRTGRPVSEDNSAPPNRSKSLICYDLSNGKEPHIKIPVYNEVNGDRTPPQFRYITTPELTNGVKQSIISAAKGNGGKDKFFMPFGSPLPSEQAYIEGGLLAESTPCGLLELGAPPGSCRVVSQGTKLPLEVFLTETKGWGVRCSQDISSGAYICDYVGEVISELEGEQLKGKDHYLFGLDEFHLRLKNTISKQEAMAPLDADTKASWNHRCKASQEPLLLQALEAGNVGRLLNHDPNANCIPQVAFTDELHSTHYYQVCFFACKDIPAYEELLYDYGYDHNGVGPEWWKAGNCGNSSAEEGGSSGAGSLGEDASESKTEQAPSRAKLRSSHAQRKKIQIWRGELFRGVNRIETAWSATATISRRRVSCGIFATAVEAARAYDRAILSHGIQDVALNFPESDYHRSAAPLAPIYTSGQASEPATTWQPVTGNEMGNQAEKALHPYRGVSLVQEKRQWSAKLVVQGRTCLDTLFSSSKEVARAWDRAVLANGREAGRNMLNFGLGDYGSKPAGHRPSNHPRGPDQGVANGNAEGQQACNNPEGTSTLPPQETATAEPAEPPAGKQSPSADLPALSCPPPLSAVHEEEAEKAPAACPLISSEPPKSPDTPPPPHDAAIAAFPPQGYHVNNACPSLGSSLAPAAVQPSDQQLDPPEAAAGEAVGALQDPALAQLPQPAAMDPPAEPEAASPDSNGRFGDRADQEGRECWLVKLWDNRTHAVVQEEACYSQESADAAWNRLGNARLTGQTLTLRSDSDIVALSSLNAQRVKQWVRGDRGEACAQVASTSSGAGSPPDRCLCDPWRGCAGAHWGHSVPWEFDGILVGRRLRLLCKFCRAWHTLKVVSYKADSRLFEVHREDQGGTSALLSLWNQDIEWLPSDSSVSGVSPGLLRSAIPSCQEPSKSWSTEWEGPPEPSVAGPVGERRLQWEGVVSGVLVAAVRTGRGQQSWHLEQRYHVAYTGREAEEVLSLEDLQDLQAPGNQQPGLSDLQAAENPYKRQKTV